MKRTTTKKMTTKTATTIELIRPRPDTARIRFASDNGVQILSTSLISRLRDVIDELADDRALRVVVFEAEGRTFLAGADLRELKALTKKTARKYSRMGQKLMQRIAELPAVTLAAIHAPCAGGGCEMALACDLRMAAESARIGLPEVTLGLIPGWGGTARSTVLLGPAVARRMILSGELLPAPLALSLGLVDSVFPDAAFRTAVESRIETILRGGPQAVARAKRLIRAIDSVEMVDLLDMEADEFAACYRTKEPAEGLEAFLEKRSAGWGT
jgi:enoyl-CoA hydratase